MTIHKWGELKRERISEERLAEIENQVRQEVLELNLAAVRALAGMSQVEVADEIGATQPEVSRVERRSDHLVSTLRQYVHALGGELEIIARFGDRSVRLRGV